jgi:hypothetical protein
MQILFTDIDGCLNSAQSAELYYGFNQKDKSDFVTFKSDLGPGCRSSEFCPIAVSNYNYILKEIPDLKVVISSYWRVGKSIDELKEIFTWLGLPADRIIDKTPILSAVQRGIEITTWLSKNPEVTEYAVIDDDDDMESVKPGAFFHLDNYVGLTYRDSQKIIKYYRK